MATINGLRLYPEEDIQNIANILKAGYGNNSTYTIGQMASGILNVPSGSGDEIQFLSILSSTTNLISVFNTYSSQLLKIKPYLFNGVTTGLQSIYLPECEEIGKFAFYGNTSISFVSLPKVKIIRDGAFWNVQNAALSSYTLYLPECTYIEERGFALTKFSSINLPKCTKLGTTTFIDNGYSSGAFASMSSYLTNISLPLCSFLGCGTFFKAPFSSVNLPEVITTGAFTFYSCTNLISASLPKCVEVGSSAFYACSKLTTVNLLSCETVYQNAFSNCYSLTEIYLPKVKTMGSRVFQNCSLLSSVSLPVCTNIHASAPFGSCSSLTIISLPALISFDGVSGWRDSGCFDKCINLSVINLPKYTGTIFQFHFRSCYNLLSLYLGGSTVCTLESTNAFTSTPISNYTTSTGGVHGSIYVLSSLYNSYKTATNWVTYSNRFASY